MLCDDQSMAVPVTHQLPKYSTHITVKMCLPGGPEHQGCLKGGTKPEVFGQVTCMLQTLTISVRRVVDNLRQIQRFQLLECRIFCRSANKMYPEGAVRFDYPVKSGEQDCLVRAVLAV